MSSSDSTVTYTSISSEDVPFWGIRFFSMEQPDSPEAAPQSPIQTPPDEHVLPAEEQSLPLVVSPTTESPKYVAESGPEEDLEEYEDDESEDGLVDYPMDGGDDGDIEDGDSSGDDADDEEEEEHLDSIDFAFVVPAIELASISLPLEAKTKEQLEEEENIAIESINETPAQKATKRRKLNEEVKDLKIHLEIMPDEDDDVYTDATPLARKVPVVDYEIIHLTTNLTTKSFELMEHTSYIAMFKRPDGQAQVWKSQRTVYGQANVKSWKLLESCGVHIITFTTTQLILLVERRYPFLRFTLDQMLNVVRLRVEEQSEMSLELLRFTRQQHQEGQLE
nr:hypothetical protein [Tanacetum cinerariifolium]